MNKTLGSEIEYLFSPQAIREQCRKIFELSLRNKTHFTIDLEQIEPTAHYVQQIIQQNYPDLNIPYHSRWNHFKAGSIDRLKILNNALEELSFEEQTKAKIELVITSVLLDAGAGHQWKYVEKNQKNVFSRSEGLAIASFALFMDGFFSHNKNMPMRVDSQRLQKITLAELEGALQVKPNNQLEGLEGRLKLLQNLGKIIEKKDTYFESFSENRLGNLCCYFLRNADNKKISAVKILRALQDSLGDIWPGRVTLNETNMGDTWLYQPLGTGTEQYVPFHKLSQWLTYSLIEPLEDYGLSITDLNNLTGLAEYRNGGLMIDKGIITLKDKSLFNETHTPKDDIIVEWRALTISLLDLLGEAITKLLNTDLNAMPLVNILEGGTWHAGRKAALEKRPETGSPPFKIKSDGTVF
ncbi:MAG: URC4/urg3 family protein [Silvanigrellaceae bacterium]|nr:URC4/urg3 family protein [Silvanigrellaceae bacterium]